MCAECDGDDLFCSWCGEDCFGKCEDPDSCPSCWTPLTLDMPFCQLAGEESEMENCLDELCRCNCHNEIYEDMEYRWEAGVFKRGENDSEPYIRKGVFRFLSLPAEVRKHIYKYTFAQEGKQRISPNHRGTIHTALLQSCREVYKEAGDLPLTANQVCFGDPQSALDFIGFSLHKTVRHLLKSLHIEMGYCEWYAHSTNILLKRLPELPLSHLGITFKGSYTASIFTDHTCYLNCIRPIKGLESFTLKLASAAVSSKVEKEAEEKMKAKLIDGYISKDVDEQSSAEGTGSHRKKIGEAKVQTQLQGPNLEICKPRSRSDLIADFALLKQYATSIDLEASLVFIRLEKAREAAESHDQTKFETLAYSIRATLEEHVERLLRARYAMLTARVGAALPKVAFSVAMTCDENEDSDSSNSDDSDSSDSDDSVESESSDDSDSDSSMES